MSIYKVKLTYDSPNAIGYDDDVTLTVGGDLEDLQSAVVDFYSQLGILEHQRCASQDIEVDGKPADLKIGLDCSIKDSLEGRVILPAPEKPSAGPSFP